MLLDQGEEVAFDLVDGRQIDAPKRAGMLNDDTGKAWPKCSLLVMSYRRGSRAATDDEMKGAPKNYLGGDYPGSVSMIQAPPKSLSEWKFVGDVKKLFYWRPGRHQGKFHHEFNKPKGLVRLLFIFRGKMKAKLYRRGRVFRIELEACWLDSRGIVRP